MPQGAPAGLKKARERLRRALRSGTEREIALARRAVERQENIRVPGRSALFGMEGQTATGGTPKPIAEQEAGLKPMSAQERIKARRRREEEEGIRRGRP